MPDALTPGRIDTEESHSPRRGHSRHVLLVEQGAEDDVPRTSPRELLALDVACEPRVLLRDAASDALRLEPVATGHGAPGGPIFEPLGDGARADLLMLSDPFCGLRVNGLPAGAVAVLRIGDEVRVDARTRLHVTAWESLTITAPRPEWVGRPCGVCLVPFSSTTRVYVCEECGHARHAEGDETPAEERLECHLLGPCDNCGRPVPAAPGFVHTPEL